MLMVPTWKLNWANVWVHHWMRCRLFNCARMRHLRFPTWRPNHPNARQQRLSQLLRCNRMLQGNWALVSLERWVLLNVCTRQERLPTWERTVWICQNLLWMQQRTKFQKRLAPNIQKQDNSTPNRRARKKRMRRFVQRIWAFALPEVMKERRSCMI